ncbi:MAG: carboxypeptidase regulatory-like domain-containing protein [Acidobacteria bacterium]|nr:carboxypeptidase regulatory-like domain-containing protein [Acidobacteriota bacterium]
MRAPRFVCALLLPLAAGLLPAQYRPPAPGNNPPFFKGDKKKEDAKTRSLNGVVKDEQDNPADSAVVQLKDTKTLQVRSFITKEDGAYQFHGLSTDVEYQVKAARQGASSDTKSLSVFDSRKSATINLKLERPRK